jgi:hypothetical protein
MECREDSKMGYAGAQISTAQSQVGCIPSLNGAHKDNTPPKEHKHYFGEYYLLECDAV